MDDVSKDPKFWEWLRNRDKPAQQEQRVQLELPKPPVYRSEDSPREPERGVCIIEVM